MHGLRSAIVILCAMAASVAGAATAITDIGPGTQSSSGNSEIGWYFSLSSDITVTHIGAWDAAGDGLEQSATRVRIWTADNANDTYVDATFAGGTGAPLENGFRWIDIDDVALTAADGPYTISQNNWFGSGQTWWIASPNTPTVSSPVNLLESRGAFNPGQFPTVSSPSASALIGPNFKFVPEPASLALLGLGALALRRRRA